MKLVVLLLGLLVAAEVRADTAHDAAKAYQEGQRLYLAEEYERAAKQFEVAYSLDSDPAYLFNIAQSYRLAKQCVPSMKFFRRFVAAVPNPPNLADVKRYMNEQEACARTATPDIEPTPPTVVTPPPSVTITPPPEVAPPPETPVASDAGRTRRRLGFAAVGVGAIGIGVGIGFTVHVGTIEEKRARVCPVPCTEWTEEHDAREAKLLTMGNRATVLAVTGFALGGVAIATGAYLWFSSRRHTERGIVVVPTRNGALLSTAF